MNALLKGELVLTADVLMGLVLGEAVMFLRIPSLLEHLPTGKLPRVTVLAVTASFGSSKAGAALIASSLEASEISEHNAIFSVLMLPLPSYLKRWPATFMLAVSMAGTAGALFALSLLVRSVLRFVWAFMMVDGCSDTGFTVKQHKPSLRGLIRRTAKTLPTAWLFFAVAYSLVPVADSFFAAHFSGSLLPVAGWTVAAGSIAHVSGALAVAGGALSRGELNTRQALFALVLGSGLGTATRILRQNAGYYYGLFRAEVARKMLLWNFITATPLIAINAVIAYILL